MKYKQVKLINDAILDIYLCEDTPSIVYKPRPGMLILPGGGYGFISFREGEPVALRYLSEGFNCFVLSYSVNTSYPIPQKEVAIAMDYINKHADEFNVAIGKISLIGFSAGGHLAGSYGYLYESFAKELGVIKGSLRPLSILLCYAVITLGNDTHVPSAERITGGKKELYDLLSVEKHITSNYPPTFIWATKEDELVPVVNTTLMIDSLNKAGVLYKALIYEHGPHGGSLCNCGVWDINRRDSVVYENQTWVNDSVKFIFDLFEK